MADKKISQLPLGELSPNSLFLSISNGATSQITFNDILIQASVNDKFITAATYNQIEGITTFYLSDGVPFNVTGYFAGYNYIPENVANKQNSMILDGGGFKYPTVDAVNQLANDVALSTINTGFIDPNDTFIMTRVDSNTLALSASNKGIIYKSLLETPPFALDTAILNIPDTILDLNSIGLILEGIYIIYIGYNDTEDVVLSNTNFNTATDTTQLGILILKVLSGATSFLDSTRGIINMPTIAAYSNLEKTILGLKSNVIVIPNDGTMTISNTAGSLKGMSVNWHGVNNDEKLISSSTATSFTHLSQGNALIATPPTFISAVTTNQYWNGSTLVNLSTSGAASIQRWIVTINGTLALQYGEREYNTLDEALDNVDTVTFLDIIPPDTYVEIARMVAISATTDVGNTQQCIFRVTDGVGSGGETVETVWGQISGNIHDQTDLFTTFEPNINAPFVDLGNTSSPATNINLNLGKNLKVTLVGSTFFNFIPSTEGSETDLIIKVQGGINPTLQFSSNVIWDNNTVPTIRNLDGGRDTTFLGTFSTGQVNALAILPNDNILYGGTFTTYNGLTRNRIVQANSDGSIDSTFNIGTGFNNTVQAIALQSDGKVLVGGLFTSYNNNAFINRLARINTDGNIDSSFNIVTGFNNTVNAIALQSDQKIIVGGVFTSYNGVLVNSIARLNTDGNLDTGFNIGTGFNSNINAIAVQTDNKILIGGSFIQYSGITANKLLRLNSDASYDSTFNIGSGFDGTISAIVIQPDNKIVVGGQFSSYSPIFVNRYTKIDYSGNQDTSFNVGGGFNGNVTVSVQQLNGKIVVGGGFTSYDGVSANSIIRLNADGTRDTSFNIGTGFNNTVNAIALQPDGKIVVAGAFVQYNGFNINKIIRLNTDGTRDNSFSVTTGFNNDVVAMFIQYSDNKIVCGGSFTTYNNNGIANRIGRINTDGTVDVTFSGSNLVNSTVQTIAQQLDGKILVAGVFTGGFTRLNSNASTDITFTSNISVVYAIAFQSDGKIIVGGNFSNVNNITASRIARLNLDGSLDGSFNSFVGFNSSIIGAVSVQSDGKILAGGNFTLFNNLPQTGFIRLNSDGSKDATFITAGANSQVSSFLQVSGETKMFLGGFFTSFGGVRSYSIARLNTDGSLDNSFDSTNGFNGLSSVNSLAIQPPNSKILVGGGFTSYSGITSGRLARLNTNGTYDSGFIVGNGFPNSNAFAISLQSNGKILVGGGFTQYNGVSATRIIRFNSSLEIDYYFKLLQDGQNIIIK